MSNSSIARQLPQNTHGKDYVVGDLHGCFDLLEQLLEKVHFNTSSDRLFSVGDLIDRGPNSLRCLELLAEPWFYAVQGNHENMMVNFFLPYLDSGQLKSLDVNDETGFLDYGGDWIQRYFQPDRERMSDEFNHCLALALEMPMLWVVGEGESRFHVIHGELVRPDYHLSKQIVWLDRDIDRWVEGEEIPPYTLERLYWGRTLMSREAGASYSGPVQKGLSTTFCGHTFSKTPCKVLSHLCIDTGAFLSANITYTSDGCYGLTLFDVREASWFKASFGLSCVTAGAYIQSR
jgi:serine/threonine protein phosphatase 1